jgi:membrane-associated phospholipid phosphatase
MLAALLPFRLRPLYNPELHLHRAFTLDSNTLETWSSFPSDHAVLFFAIATGVFLVHRRAGVCLFLYTTFFIALPRIFLGFHYPSDLLAGGLFGGALAYSAKWPAFRTLITRPGLRLQERSPGLFYACFFFLTVQTAELYGSLRAALNLAYRVLIAWSNSPH